MRVQQEPDHEHRLGHLPDHAFRRRPEGDTHHRAAHQTSRSLGSGEPVQCPVAGAIANAFFDATGVRITEAPMTAGRVRATLKAAGVA